MSIAVQRVVEPPERGGAGASTPSVFISYRRSETAGHAGRLYDAMATRFGDANVFMDVDLQPGVDFVERISTIVAACDVLLVVIGPEWAEPGEGQTRPRISDPNDFVGLEVGTALRRSDVTVIPLLVAGGRMPAAEALPEPLRPLTRRNALELSDVRWHYDVGRLVGVLERLLAQRCPPGEPCALAPVDGAADASPRPRAKIPAWMRRRAPALGGAVAVAVAALLAFLVLAPGGPDGARNPRAVTPVPGHDARPAEVPPTCKNRGMTQWAKDVEAQRQWNCPVADTDAVTGAGFTYLEFADAPEAHSSFLDSKAYELGHGWESCPRTPSERLDVTATRDAWCLRSTSDGTVEISWHTKGSNVVGVLTADRPTTVAGAVELWQRLA